MLNKLLPAVFAVITAGFAAQADDTMTYFTCDFTNGMPSGAVLEDRDNQEQHFSMVQNGFAERDSWIIYREQGTDNYCAASSSRHKSVSGQDPVAADDWLILPRVFVRGGDARMTWRSRSFNDATTRLSSYDIMVSETEGVFDGKPVMSVSKETDMEWVEHSLDLGAYAGKKIYIAFVNNSLNCEMVAVDDIVITGQKGLAELVLTPGEYALGNEAFKLGGKLTAYSKEVVNSLAISVDVEGGQKLQAEYKDLALGYHDTFEFELPGEVSAEYGRSVSYSVSYTVNTTEYDAENCATTLLAFKPERKVVVEEATGMWCQYCPKGIVAFEVLQEKYPDTFLGIAVHMNAELDVLALDSYANRNTFTGGAPSAWVDRTIYSTTPMVPVRENGRRTYTTLMGGLETDFLTCLETVPLADIQLYGDLDGNSLNLHTVTRFPVNREGSDIRLAFVVTEDHVWGNRYYQMNLFGGGDEELGGFEKLKGRITEDFEFNHVARALYGDWEGYPGRFPKEITAGESYDNDFKLDLPTTILDMNNARIIGMVIDNASGKVLNANVMSLGTGSLDLVGEDASGLIRVEPSASGVRVVGLGLMDVTVSDLSGRTVARVSANGTADVQIDTCGIYIVTVKGDNGCVAVKVAI